MTVSGYALRFGALGYLALLLLVPVGFVFYRAFEHGARPRLGRGHDARGAARALS